MTPEFLAIAGFRQVWRAIRERGHLLGVLPNLVERRSRLGSEALVWLEVKAGPLLPAIPRSARLRECPLAGQTLFSYAPEDRAIQALRLCAEEVMRRAEKGLYVRPGV